MPLDAEKIAMPEANCPDGMQWAKAFVAHAKLDPSLATDEACMVGWFANAMMAMHDHIYQNRTVTAKQALAEREKP